MESVIQKTIQKIQAKGVDYIRVKVIPKSPVTELTEVLDDGTWKIRLRAVPEKGKANQELIKFLAKETGVPKNCVSIVSGATDRTKLVKIMP